MSESQFPVTRRAILSGALASAATACLPKPPEARPSGRRSMDPILEMTGWEIEVSTPVEHLTSPWDLPTHVPVRQDIRVTTHYLVHRDYLEALESVMRRSLGKIGTYRLERPGTVITGIAVFAGVRVSPVVDLLPGENVPSMYRIEAEFRGIDDPSTGHVGGFGSLDLIDLDRTTQREGRRAALVASL